MKRRNTDTNFQKLAAQINNAIIQNEGLIGDQKAQVELLMQMEAKFKHSLLKYKELHVIYEKFIDYVVLESGNILSASPYFREPVKVFRSGISKAIKERDVKSLMQYRINFKLIKFIVDRWSGALPERASRYYNESETMKIFGKKEKAVRNCTFYCRGRRRTCSFKIYVKYEE